MILQLILGNTPVDVRDVDIPVVLRSPIFPTDTGKIPGSFIFNFTVPFTDELKRELVFPNRPSRSGTTILKKPFKLNFGVLHYQGTASVSMVSNTELELSMPVETGDLNSVLKETKLSQLDLGGQQEIMPFFSLAFNQEGYYINKSWGNNPPPQVGYFSISFVDHVLVDFKSQFQLGAASYVGCEANNGITTRMSFNCTLKHYQPEISNTDIFFRLLKNNAVIYSSLLVLEQDNLCQFDFMMAKDDIISYEISARSALWQQTEYICFWVTNVSIEFRPLNVYPYNNTVNKFYPDANFAVFPFENPAFFDDMDDDWFMIDNISAKELYSNYFPVFNYWIASEFPIVLKGSKMGESYMAANLFSPCVFVAFLIDKLLSHIGYTAPYNPFIHDIDLRGLVLFNNYAENNYSNKNFLRVSLYTNLKDHVPELTIGEFLRDVCQFFGIVFQSNTTKRTITFKWLKDIMNDNTSVVFRNDSIAEQKITPVLFNGFLIKQNFGSDSFISDNYKSLDGLNYKGRVDYVINLPFNGNQINDCYFVTSRRQYFIWNYDNEPGTISWKLYTLNFFFEYKQDPVEGVDGEQFTMETNLAPLMDNKYMWLDLCLNAPGYGGPIPDWRHWIIPSTQQPGVFEGLSPDIKAESTHSLTFYRGLQKDHRGYYYPMASSDVYNYDGVRIATQPLRLDGPDGIYENFLKLFVEWYTHNANEISFKMILDVDEIANLNFFRWHIINGVRYLLKEVRFNIRNHSISPAEIIALRR